MYSLLACGGGSNSSLASKRDGGTKSSVLQKDFVLYADMCGLRVDYDHPVDSCRNTWIAWRNLIQNEYSGTAGVKCHGKGSIIGSNSHRCDNYINYVQEPVMKRLIRPAPYWSGHPSNPRRRALLRLRVRQLLMSKPFL